MTPAPTPIDVMVPVSTPPVQITLGAITVEGFWGAGPSVSSMARWRAVRVPVFERRWSWQTPRAPQAPHWKAPDSRWGGT
jgi:hypothetical protein